MKLHHADESVTLWHGDCLEVLRAMNPDSIDACVTDPPYDLTAGKRGGTGAASVNLDSPYGRSRIGTGNGSGGFMGKAWDSTGIAFRPDVWRECLRVLKPGGYLLSFGGSRTWHRLACAVEDAGFEIRDSIAWLSGSGFPKSMDVSKAIDKAAGATREVIGQHANPAGNKAGGASLNMSVVGMPETADITAPATDAAKQWQGWGTALKPAFEPIVVARKPLGEKTVAANVLAHGTGALNIDATRVATTDKLGGGANKGMTSATRHEGFARPWMNNDEMRDAAAARSRDNTARAEELGRWPTNVVLDGDQADELDRQSGISRSSARPRCNTAEAHNRTSSMGKSSADWITGGHDDQGGASRFFPVFRYEAKAPTSERPSVNGVAHPTVKPLDLMRWLVRLVTPPGGVVLDPFAGSGTTAEACIHEHRRCITIEREADYLPLITARLSKPMEVGFDFGEVS